MPVLLVEPPGPHLPARIRLIAGLRLAAATGALVLAVLSRGDALALAALLAVAAWRPLAAAAVGSALVAGTWRWGSTSLEALAGAQAVLGPAVSVGPTRLAVASALAGAAVLLAAPELAGTKRTRGALGARYLLVAAATGATVAALVAGPAPGGAVWVRVLAGLAATGAAVLRSRRRGWGLDAAGAVAGIAAVAIVAGDGPAWSGVLDADALWAGAAVAVAVAAVALTAATAVELRRGATSSAS